MNYLKKGENISSTSVKYEKCRPSYSDDEDVILLSDEEKEDNNKCMICYCILTDSQLARVKALMIDNSDSTNMFNNYCRLLNIVLLETIQWDFQVEPMPFCSACLAMVKTLGQLSDKLVSIKSQISGILEIIKSEILKSKKKESKKVNFGKGSAGLRNSFMLSPLEKVDYCRNEAIKDLIPENAPVMKTEATNDSSEVLCETVYDNRAHSSGMYNTQVNENEYKRKRHHEINNELMPHNSEYKSSGKSSSATKRKEMSHHININHNVHEQIRQISSTQQGHFIDQCQSSSKTHNIHSNVDNSSYFGVQDSLSSSYNESPNQSVDTESELAFSQYYHKVPESSETVFMECSSRVLRMEDIAKFDPRQTKEKLNTGSVSHKKSRVETLPSQMVVDESESNDVMEDDGSSFTHQNIEIVENSDYKGAHKCKVCERRFTTRNSATTHIQAVHLKVKKIQCKLCTKTFFKKFNCLVHINKVHLKGTYSNINPESAIVYLLD